MSRLSMSARLICSASPTSVGSRQRLRSATTSALAGRHTQLPLSATDRAFAADTPAAVEQPAGGRAVVHVVPAVPASSQG